MPRRRRRWKFSRSNFHRKTHQRSGCLRWKLLLENFQYLILGTPFARLRLCARLLQSITSLWVESKSKTSTQVLGKSIATSSLLLRVYDVMIIHISASLYSSTQFYDKKVDVTMSLPVPDAVLFQICITKSHTLFFLNL